MDYILFVAYLLLFSWLVTRTGFFTKTGLTKAQLIILFLLKLIAGIFYGWMGNFYGGMAQMVDTWNYHHHGLREYEILLSNPREYFTNLFVDPYHRGFWETLFQSKDSFWNDLKANVFIKLLSIFDVFSFGYYYVNVIFYTFITLIGPMAFYRVMAHVFPGEKKMILLAVFLVPSFLYWTSGIHKEGLIFTAIAIIIYHCYFAEVTGHWNWKRWAGIAVGFFILFLLRNFLIAVMLPAIVAWLLANRYPRYAMAVFMGVYLIGSVAFFSLRYIDPRLDFPQAVADKQQAFVKLEGYSSIPIRELEPTAASFIRNIPQAITLSVVRPYPSDVRHILSLAATVETDLLLLLFLLFLLFRRRHLAASATMLYFCVFFSLSVLLSIGFTVNNLGAVVRYRSVVMPLLATIMIAQTDWRMLIDFFSGKNKKNPVTTAV